MGVKSTIHSFILMIVSPGVREAILTVTTYDNNERYRAGDGSTC